MSAFGLGVPYTDRELESRVGAGLERVEEQLGAAVGSAEGFLGEAAGHLLRAGGKRFRPLVVLLGSEFGDRESADVVPAAVVVELTHLATLYHDDVMDEADLRRGAQSANARWDNSIAILTGDYLFAVASQTVSRLGTEAVRIQAETFSRLVDGQIRETLGPGEGEDALEHYLRVVEDKTGSLIATSALFGAMMSGAPRDVQTALGAFGERIGAAFQLSDDIIDVASETGESGKTPGTDLREGVPTLPSLLASRSSARDDDRLLALLSGPIVDSSEHAEALALLREHPAMDEARACVHGRASEARAMLKDLPQVGAREALESLCDLVVTRIG